MAWTLARIYGHCDDEDGCRLWNGALLKKRYPICQEPAPERPHGQRQVHVRRLVWELATGAPAPAGPKYVLVARCGHERCVAEDCLVLMTKGRRLRLAAAGGRSLAYRAKVAAGRRRGSKLSDEAVAGVFGSEEKVEAIAARLGISVGYASALRRGEARRDYTSPFAALQAAPARRRP